MKHLIIFFTVIFLFSFSEGYSQFPETKDSYKFPWAGGMNSVQFGEIDINLDGIKDLMVFDRQGNRIIPFINHGIPNSVDYSFAPEFVDNFPKLYAWAIFADYDNDGKADIFTYSPGWAGMLVYKNISTTALKFKLEVSPYLTSYYGDNQINILVTYADYPAISDIDNDGDLDILTFWGLGSFVEMHKNMSMETYGNADSLLFKHTETCWGHFAESDESNVLYLDTCVGKCYPENQLEVKHDRHTGSTFLMIDLDADNDKDLLLADVDYPGMFALINGGTPDDALITEIDTLFPDESGKPVRIFSMPAAAYIDVNNDGKKDLLVSSFDPSPFISKNLKNVYLYNNSGENNNPHFSFKTDTFLQDEMIDVGSGAMPELYDFDGDGDLDLFIGNYGYYKRSYYDEHYTLHTDYKSAVFCFENIGSQQEPVFKPVDFDFGGFYLEDTAFINLKPTFGDINADGVSEMIVGNSNGTLILTEFKNDNIIKTYDYAGIDVGDYSTPQLFDLDKDGLLDLIIGGKNGKLSYYHNIGNVENPSFEFVTDFLGEVDVTDYDVSWYGYSVPYFFRLENGETRLLTGSETGVIHLYKSIDGNLSGAFEPNDSLGDLIGVPDFDSDRGFRSAAVIANLYDDNSPELIAGNFSGGLEFFGGNPEVLMSVKEKKIVRNNLITFPNPAKEIVNIILDDYIKNGNVEIYSLDGKLVQSININVKTKRIKLNVAHLETGIYVIKLHTANNIFTSKFIINR